MQAECVCAKQANNIIIENIYNKILYCTVYNNKQMYLHKITTLNLSTCIVHEQVTMCVVCY